MSRDCRRPLENKTMIPDFLYTLVGLFLQTAVQYLYIFRFIFWYNPAATLFRWQYPKTWENTNFPTWWTGTYSSSCWRILTALLFSDSVNKSHGANGVALVGLNIIRLLIWILVAMFFDMTPQTFCMVKTIIVSSRIPHNLDDMKWWKNDAWRKTGEILEINMRGPLEFCKQHPAKCDYNTIMRAAGILEYIHNWQLINPGWNVCCMLLGLGVTTFIDFIPTLQSFMNRLAPYVNGSNPQKVTDATRRTTPASVPHVQSLPSHSDIIAILQHCRPHRVSSTDTKSIKDYVDGMPCDIKHSNTTIRFFLSQTTAHITDMMHQLTPHKACTSKKCARNSV